MGQKVSPIGFRTGITRGWRSRWFAPKSAYGEFLVEDAKIRRFVDDRLNRKPPYAGIASIEIERTRGEVRIVLHTSRPGLVIGPKGAEVDRLREALEDLIDRKVTLNVVEVKAPDLDAQLVAEGVAEQLRRRGSFRRAIRQAADNVMASGGRGVKVIVSGRLGGAEIARSERQVQGSIPLHTLQADVDYGFAIARTTYGAIGVKVWIHRGAMGDIIELEKQQQARPRGRRPGGAPGR